MKKYQYGIDVDTLDKFIHEPKVDKTDFGTYSELISTQEFRLERVELFTEKEFVLTTDLKFETTVFVESGDIKVKGASLQNQDVYEVPISSEVKLFARKDTVVYLFSGPERDDKNYFVKRSTTDNREKYWGDIKTIVGKDYTGKRLFVKKGTNASLEYHCRKIEAYFIHSGKLLLRLRAGRGEDRFFNLEKRMTSFTPPGLMHQRGGLEDTVIIEISTKDEDGDSFLVEDGQTTSMPKL